MDERDLANWRAIDSGLRAVTWADFVGDVDGAAFLSNAGRSLGPRLIEGLDNCFGPHWLGAAIGPDGRGRIPWLGKFSPTLTVVGGERGAAGAFIELVRWWAAFESQATMPGMAQVRRDLTSDVSPDRLLHALTQVRLGAIATTAGMDVRYEPTPGDLQISSDTDSVTVEVFAMRTAEFVETQHRVSREMFAFLDDLGRRLKVHFRGSMPSLDADLQGWRERVSNDAATVSRTGISLSIGWGGAELIVEPGDAPGGTTLDGPATEGDVGTRLHHRVASKARQVAQARAGWLWLENHGAVDMLVPIHHMPLVDQLGAYEKLFDGALDSVASALGITFSSAGARTWPPPPVQHSFHEQARALRQPLPLDRVRTSFHLPKLEAPVSRMMWRILEQEKDWLDDALNALGVHCTAPDLLRADLRVPA